MNLTRVLPSDQSIKMFDSLIAATDNLFRGYLKKKIFFLHIHKCGGVSISQAIKSCYLTLDMTKDRRIFTLDAEAAFNAAQKSIDRTDFASSIRDDDYLRLKLRENLLLYYMCQRQTGYINGHFSFSPAAYQYFSDQYAFITVLRNPVKRWISAYFYNRYKKQGQRKLDMEISAYLESEHAQRQGCSYVKLLGGPNKTGDYTSEEAINQAKANLHKFSIVGFLEHQEDFVKQFEEQFGRKLRIRSLNQSPKSGAYQRSIITEEIEEKIKAICRPDIEVYQYAVNNFVKVKKSTFNFTVPTAQVTV